MNRFLAFLILALLALPAIAQNQFRIDAPSGVSSSGYLRVMPTYTDRRVLGVATNENHTLPAGSRWVIFSSNCSEWYAKRDGTAAIAAGDVTDGTASTMNPAGFDVNGVTTIGLISPAACTITIDVYK